MGEPGLKGFAPSRNFKIFRTDFPAIFRFNGMLFQENYDIDTMESNWIEIDEAEAKRWLDSQSPEYKKGVDAGIRMAAQLVRSHMMSDTGRQVAEFLIDRANRVTPDQSPRVPGRRWDEQMSEGTKNAPAHNAHAEQPQAGPGGVRPAGSD